jgi:hypothetical protein
MPSNREHRNGALSAVWIGNQFPIGVVTNMARHKNKNSSQHDSIAKIAESLEQGSKNRPIGGLQALRKRLKNLKRQAGTAIFHPDTISHEYAFHYGGRSELQFNIGFEDGWFRFGVAFSLEPSQTLPNVAKLLPSIEKFNDAIRESPQSFNDLIMWHFESDRSHPAGYRRSDDRTPAAIPATLVRNGVFIFMGKKTPRADINLDEVIDLFDRLLPLYARVESSASVAHENISLHDARDFDFIPGCSIKSKWSQATQTEKTIDINLLHNFLQERLFQKLANEYGEERVGTEIPSGTDGRIDAVVRFDEEYWFYEIKTALTARSCIREALPQLLEYAYWPKATEATRLFVVGMPELDEQSRCYLDLLRIRFGIPIDYLKISRS